MPPSFTDGVFTEEPPRHWLHGLWEYMRYVPEMIARFGCRKARSTTAGKQRLWLRCSFTVSCITMSA